MFTNLSRILRELTSYKSAVCTIPALIFLWTGCGQGADPASNLEAALMKVSIDDLSSTLEAIAAPENAEKLKKAMAEPLKDPLAAIGRSGVDISGTILKPSHAFMAKLKASGINLNKTYQSTADYLAAIGASPKTKISKPDLSKGLKIAAQILENPDSLGLVGDEQMGLALADTGDQVFTSAEAGSYATARSSTGGRDISNSNSFNSCQRNTGNMLSAINGFLKKCPPPPPGRSSVCTLQVDMASFMNFNASVNYVVNNCGRVAANPGKQKTVANNAADNKSLGPGRPTKVTRQGNTVTKSNGNSTCMASGDNADCSVD